MNKQKGSPRFAGEAGLAPILIVLLAALIVGGYLLYTNYSNNRYKTSQQTANSTPAPTSASESTTSAASPALNGTGETAGWKTYTGSNFSFKYPANLQACIKDNNISKDSCRADSVLFINVSSSQKGTHQTLAEQYSSSGAGAAKAKPFTDSQNRKWTIVDHGGAEGGLVSDADTVINNNLYLVNIQMSLKITKESVRDPLMNQIVSTFKFL